MRNTSKLEAMIENCRSEGKWQKVMELTDELKIGSPKNEYLTTFLMGEARLESFLEDNPPIESNFVKAKAGLQDAKQYLNFVTGENGQKAGIALDAYLLLAKLHYACGEYESSLENFTKAELNTLAEKELTLRSLKILAESYAIKGICLEDKMSKPSSKFKKSEMETEMINCFERATDLGLLFLQEQDVASYSVNTNNSIGSTLTLNAGVQQSTSNLTISSTLPANPIELNRRMGIILETALQRAPIVLIKSGKLMEAINRYRIMLNAIETKTTQFLRLTLARQLAEVLLRGVSGTIYSTPFQKPQQATSSSLKSQQSSKHLWKPRNYSTRNQFTPRNQQEEIILLLLIAEVLAVRDTVLSQSPEFRVARIHAMGNVMAIYDLLTLATVRWGLIQMLHESFEKALKFSFGEQHIWRQYGISLMSSEANMHALQVLQESMKLNADDPLPCLLASKLCYESLGLIREGLEYAKEALKRENKDLNKTTGQRPSRSQLYVGIGYQQLAIQSMLKLEREHYYKLSLEALEKATHNDSNDHLCEYYLSLQYALLNNIPEAINHIRYALTLRTEYAPSLHLFALLLTTSRRPREALVVVEEALEEFPDNLNLLEVKAHLQLFLQDAEVALATVKRMLSIWRELYEGQTTSEDEKHSDTKSVILHVPSSQMSDRDSSSVYAASLAAVSRVEQALSEVASSLSSFTPRSGPHRPWMIQIKIWLLLAEVYLSIDQPSEAMVCIQEASQIYPLSHQIMYMRGKVCLYMEQWNEAKQCFLNAVAANPNHTDALRCLGETYHILGEPRLAEKLLKDAIKLDPNCPKIWFSLGEVLETLNEFSASADCMATALNLEPSCPIIPFTTISLCFD